MSVYGFSSQQDVDRIADAVRKVEGGFFQPAGDMSGTARDDNQALVRLTGTASGGFSTGQVVIPAVDGKYVDVGEIRYREWPSNFRLARQHGITVDGKYPVYHGVAGGGSGSSVAFATLKSGSTNAGFINIFNVELNTWTAVYPEVTIFEPNGGSLAFVATRRFPVVFVGRTTTNRDVYQALLFPGIVTDAACVSGAIRNTKTPV